MTSVNNVKQIALRLGFDSRTEIQILPAALMYRKRLCEESPTAIHFRLQSLFAQQFLEPYLPAWHGPGLVSQPVSNQCEAVIDFPLETDTSKTSLSVVQQANHFFNVQSEDFLECVGFPKHHLGQMLQRLWRQHQTKTRPAAMVFISMLFPDQHGHWDVDVILWKKLLSFFASQELPVISAKDLIPLQDFQQAISQGFLCVDTKHPLWELWHWIFILMNCRMYVGPDSFLSHLAYLLGVPSIILWTENDPLMQLHKRKDKGRIAFYCHGPTITAEDVIDAYHSMERMLLPEF